MTEIILLFLTSSLVSYLCGRYHNYSRWVTSGKIYNQAKEVYKENYELKMEKKLEEVGKK